MALKINSAEGGTDGIAVTSANSGGVSGDPFNSPNKGATAVAATINFATAAAKNGTLGYAFSVGNTANVCNVFWADTTSGDFTMQCWFQITGAPATTMQGPLALTTSAGSNANLPRLQMGTGRTFTVQLSAQAGSASAALTVGLWYYLDFYGTGVSTASATATCDIYNADGSLLSSIGGTGSALGVPARSNVGKLGSGAANMVFYCDALAANLGSPTAAGFPVALTSDYVRRSGAWVSYTPSVRRSGAWV